MRFLYWLLTRRVVIVTPPGSSSMRCEACELDEAIRIAKALFGNPEQPDPDCEYAEINLEEIWNRPTFIDQNDPEMRSWN
jgi:hypothetical protein